MQAFIPKNRYAASGRGIDFVSLAVRRIENASGGSENKPF